MLRPRLAALLTLVVLALAGCGGGDDGSAGEPVAEGPDPGLQHIHGLGVSAGTLYIATHTGLWTAPAGQTNTQRLSSSRQDIMGFSLLGNGRFIGSGHPDPSQTHLPPNLGLIESPDGGRNWNSISLLGEADFHVLESAGRQVYGVNSADGALLASADGGRNWQQRTAPAGIFELAIDPRSSRRIVASTERGIFSSPNGGKRWRPTRDNLAGLLAWPTPARLYLVDGDGHVRISRDGGREWTATGNIGAQPTAFIAHGNELYTAITDATVKRSTDGGRSWTLRAQP